ncbi:hypothetical protein [Microseira sp. BLCC-F43]|uniref:hypothetical protein n=1 Tax=Microseira sp. BLCC-F43 TaxID=3153602 RepID=UPI0035B8FBE3
MRKLLSRTVIYLLIAVFLILTTAGMKVGASLIAEQFLYKIIIIGDVFSTLEVVEFVNVLVFAILGMGFGLATAFLPKIYRQKTSALLLIILVPLIFSTSAMVRYNLWIEDVAEQEKTSYAEAESLTDSFLSRRVGVDGFLGFYVYTAQFPVLPTNKAEIKKAEKLEEKVKANFMSLNKIIGMKPEIITVILAGSKWLIRTFYFSLAAFTTINHFKAGCQELIKNTKPTAPNFPPVPPRYKYSIDKPMPQTGSRRKLKSH